MPADTFDPATDEPQNRTEETVKTVYDQLEEADYGEAATLRVESRDTDQKAHLAKKLRKHLLTPDTLEQRAEAALEQTTILSEEQRNEGWKMLARADTMETSNEDHAATLREEAYALAEYGEPQSYVTSLSGKQKAQATELLGRAATMQGVDPEVSDEIHEKAIGVLEDAVKDERGDVEQFVIDRDVEATIDDLES